MDYVFLIGRVLFGGFFLLSGIKHFKNIEMMAGYAGSKGVKSAKLAVGGTGLLLIIGGLGVILGVYTNYALICLLIFLLGVTPKMHNFWTIQDPMQKMGEQVNFMKNMALLGAVLMMFILATPWAMSLTL